MGSMCRCIDMYLAEKDHKESKNKAKIKQKDHEESKNRAKIKQKDSKNRPALRADNETETKAKIKR